MGWRKDLHAVSRLNSGVNAVRRLTISIGTKGLFDLPWKASG